MDHPTVPPIPVGNRGEEVAILNTLKCACGAKLKFVNHRHRNLRDGRHYDWSRATCRSCGGTSEVLFDISDWFKTWKLWVAVAAFGLIGLFALGAATVLPGMSGQDRRNGLVAAPLSLAMAAFAFWGIRSVKTLDYAAQAPKGPSLERDEEMASALAALGIPLDFGVSDPLRALVGGAAKAGLWQGIKKLRAGDNAGARRDFETVLKGLERETDPKWEAVRTAAKKLLGQAGG